MDAKLEGLIAKIKKDGIEEAKKSSESIIEKAEAQAKTIVDQAKKEAEKIISQGKQEAQKLKANTENSLKQAARDLLLTLKNEINGLFNGIIKRKIAQELDPEFMSKLIVKIVESWSKEKQAALELLVSKADKQKLEALLFKGLKDKAKEEIEIKVSKTITRGFRIGIKGEDLHYDFTEEVLSEAFKEFLNPATSAMLDTK